MIPLELLDALAAIVGRDRVRLDAPLAPYTTFRVGGPADCLVEVRSSEELLSVVRAAAGTLGPPTILGGGSNTVISDRGIRGVVIRVHGGEIREEPEPSEQRQAPGSRRQKAKGGQPPPASRRLDGTASSPSTVLVRADAGVTINALVRWTIGRGFAGLEAWAGTPGTVGGAVYGNAHFGGRNISDFLSSVRFLAVAGGEVSELPASVLEFGYDRSRFQEAPEVILSAVFALERGGDPVRLRGVARDSLAHRKETQPLSAPSAGCIFQNPDPARDVVPRDIPCSAGALIDRAGLKGRRIGGALVSPAHANFIVSDGGASAADIRALVLLCEAEVRRQFGVELREEVRWLGEW